MSDSFLIVDVGSGYTRCGFSGELSPRLIFPSIIESDGSGDSRLVGNDAYKKSGNGSTRSVLNETGLYDSWDDFISQMDYIFKEMDVDPKKTNIFMTEIPITPKMNREKITEILFEEFEISSFGIEKDQVCTLFTTGKMTALIGSMGENFIYSVPIYEGFTLREGVHQFKNVGGKFIRTELSKTLYEEKGIELNPSLHLHNEILEDIVRKHNIYNYVEQSSNEKNGTSYHDTQTSVRYELPCGNILELDETILTRPIENLLRKKVRKHLWYTYGDPDEFEIVEGFYNSVMRVDIDVRQEFLQNIFLTGGLSQMEGMKEIIHKETMKSCSKSNTNRYRDQVNVTRCKNPEFSSFFGASLLCTYDTNMTNRVCDAEMYNENGPSITQRMGSF